MLRIWPWAMTSAHDDRQHDRAREAQVPRRDLAVIAQGQAVGGDPQRGGDGHHVAGHLAHHQAPHPEVGRRRQRDGDGEADDGLDRLQRALAPVVHAPEEHPQRRLERERDRQVGQARHQRQQPVVAVDGGDHRRQGQDDQAHRRRQRQLQRERVLELALLVGLVLLDEQLVDAHPLERDERDHGGRDDAVEPDLARAEQARDDQALDQDEPVDRRQEAGGDDRAPQRAPAQLGAGERQPVAHGPGARLPRASSTW